MLKKWRQAKNQSKILRLPEPLELPQQVKILKNMIRAYLSQALDLPLPTITTQQILKASLNTNLNQFQFLDLLSTCVMAELKKFIFKLNTTAKSNKNINWAKSRQYILQKIGAFAQNVVFIVELMSQKLSWCRCSRQACSARFNPEFTTNRITKYACSNLSDILEIKIQEPYANVNENKTFLFNIQQDQQCTNISLEVLNSNQSQQKIKVKGFPKLPQSDQVTIQFIKNLKIVQNQRQTCNVDLLWVNSLRDLDLQF